MSQLALIDATCRVVQAQAVLSLLGDEPKAMAEADGEPADYAERSRGRHEA